MNQWDSLWYNIAMASMDEKMTIYQRGALAVKDKTIAWIGDLDDLPGDPQYLATVCHQGHGQWMTPGLIDCHTHLVYAKNRSDEYAQLLSGMSYTDIAKAGGGILRTVRDTRDASFDALYQASEKRLQQFLNEGITTLEIKSGYGLDYPTERKMLQVAQKLGENNPVDIIKTCLAAHGVPEEFGEYSGDYVDFICQYILPRLSKEGLVDAVDVFCESIAFNPGQMEKIFQLAKKLNLPVKCHGEQFSNCGATPVAANYSALSVDHLEYAHENSVRLLKHAGCCAVLLPGAYYFLGEEKRPPIDLFREHQVPMAIGSDCNPGSAPITSYLTVLNMACMLFKLTIDEALLGATRHGAKALGIESQCGTLSVGKNADFVIWDVDNLSEIIYQIGDNPCEIVVKNGKQVRGDRL